MYFACSEKHAERKSEKLKRKKKGKSEITRTEKAYHKFHLCITGASKIYWPN
jgi:hypothetical protein